jgi:endonuclease/exonuclease/phosphatase family metal-dependent hydrolase
MSVLRLRILSYNIHKGFAAGNRRFVLAEIKKAIRRTEADLVLLQEVQGLHERKAARVKDWPSTSQFEFLADQVWPHYAYGKNAVSYVGHHGNAVLSKFPISCWENIDISTNQLEQRGFLHVELKCPPCKKTLHCLCLHLSLFQRGRTKQLTAVADRIVRLVPDDAPLIIGGDFNDWRRRASDTIERYTGATEVFKTVHGSYARSFPSRLPLLALDRIYVRGFVPLEASVLRGPEWKALSDHAALYAEVELES